MSAGVEARTDFGKLRYASLWEDARVLLAALGPGAKGGRLLSIASGGDNALAMLDLDPKEVWAADFSPAQLACARLKAAVVGRLERTEALAFLGVLPSSDRWRSYEALSRHLPQDDRAYWQEQRPAIEAGVIHAGKFERYLRFFGRWLLPLVHGSFVRRGIFEARPPAQRAEFYREHWDNSRWRALFSIFFSGPVLGRAGRDPAFMAQVQGSVASRIRCRVGEGLSASSSHDNPYLRYILTGNYAMEALPYYLQAGPYARIRRRTPRLRWYRGPVQNAGRGRFDGMNLSDIFEYMTPQEHEDCYGRLLRRAKPGTRLVYWNMLVPRQAPASLADRVLPQKALAARLHARDQAWLYQSLHIDAVRARRNGA